ncbi:MAG: hypothetical protein K2X66_12700 [Cyanobacteria bacterium]|nr:hypothetical protein [Cyanobacteriota bacterium]
MNVLKQVPVRTVAFEGKAWLNKESLQNSGVISSAYLADYEKAIETVRPAFEKLNGADAEFSAVGIISDNLSYTTQATAKLTAQTPQGEKTKELVQGPWYKFWEGLESFVTRVLKEAKKLKNG